MMTAKVELSTVVPVTERVSDFSGIFQAYKRGVEATGMAYEFVCVLDGEHPEILAELRKLREQGEPVKIIALAKWFGEATALSIGFAHAAGDIILTLPAYLQIAPGEIPRLVSALRDCDMVVARRFPRLDSKLNLIQSKVFHGLLRAMVDVPFGDLGCGVRVLRRRVAEELNIYGDQHRFLPLLAHQQGFKVRELDAEHAKEDAFRRVYPFGVYLRRLLDIVTIVFLVKFTKKPLRFFGLIGSFTFGLGALGVLYLVIDRLFFDVALADRPALVLAVLMIVLGFQMIAVGLIGELIIFTHAKDVRDYTIDQVID